MQPGKVNLRSYPTCVDPDSDALLYDPVCTIVQTAYMSMLLLNPGLL